MKAVIAVPASMVTAVFHMLTNGVEYRDRRSLSRSP